MQIHNYDDELVVDGELYYAQANYTLKRFYDPGDNIYTPPTSWIETEIDTVNGEPDVKFYKENTETGDIDIPVIREQELELFKKLYEALDIKIYEYESVR